MQLQTPQGGVQKPKRGPYTDYKPWRTHMAAALVRAAAKLLKAKSKTLHADAIADFLHKYSAQLPAGFNHKACAKDVWKRLQSDGHTEDRVKSGRNRVASEGDIARMLRLFLTGTSAGKEWCGYTSLAQALYLNEQMKELLANSGIKQAQMWARLQEEYRAQHKKALKPITIYEKPILTDKTKRERMACAKRWLQDGEQALIDRVFIDEKKEHIQAGSKLRCYAPANMKSFIRHADQGLQDKYAFKYAAAVAPFCGPVHLEAITGTTGLNKGFKVRT